MMQFKHAVAGVAVALALAGCQRTSYSDLGPVQTQQPAPLAAQPVGGVQSSALPDPTTDTTQFPDKPATPAPGSMPAGNPQMAAAALDVKKEAMVGNWKVSGGSGNCDMFLTLTNLGGGSRGGTRGCSGALTAMGSWEVEGKQVSIKDRSGNVIGRLYKTADTRYDGSLNSGESISLSR